MSQEYTPVDWVDETPNTPGTLINKARLDQMQTAHHYADGFEEVDAVPTADPGVDYHKVVFCTADTTFYRWDGSAWVKDVDDTTKALLEAHEADHANPHVVTKAQVGLGNCDNTADLDKPVSTAQQTALDAKLDDSQLKTSWSSPVSDANIPSEKLTKDTLDAKLDDSQLKTAWSSPVKDTNIPSEKLTKDSLDLKADKTQLSDGSVTKIGTANVGGDLKPIKIVAGVPTAVTNDLVSTAGAQTVGGAKTYTGIATHSTDGDSPRIVMKRTNLWIDDNITGSRRGAIIGFSDTGDNNFFKMTPWKTTTATYLAFYASRGSYTDVWAGEVGVKTNGTGYMQAPTPDGNTANAVATVGFIDAYTPMVRTTGNQSIGAVKEFTGQLISTGVWDNKSSGNLENSSTWRRIYYTTSTSLTNQVLTLLITPQKGTNGDAGIVVFYGASSGVSAKWLVMGSAITMANFYIVRDSNGLYEIWAKNVDGNRGLSFMRLNETNWGSIANNWTRDPTTKDASFDPTTYDAYASPTADDLVHTFGAQDIAGDKRFLANTAMKKNGLETLVAPPSNQYWGMIFTDKNNKEFGGLRCAYPTTRNQYLYLSLMDLDTDTQVQTFAFFKTHMTGPDRGYNAANIHDVATITTLDGYTPMVRTTGNQNILGTKVFNNGVYGDALGVSIARTLGYYKTHNIGTVGTETTTWYLNLMFVWRYGLTMVHCEVNFSGGAVTAVTTSDLLGRTQSGNSKIAFDIINGDVYIVVNRASQSNVYSRLMLLDLQKGASGHPSWTRLDEGELYTPSGTLIEANLI